MTSEQSAPRTTRSLITTGSFSRFFWAAMIGSTGDWVTVFAILTLANRIGSQEGILIALMSRILPGLFLGGLIGVISDRMDRRKLVVFADIGRGLVVPFLMFVDSLPVLVGLTLILEILSLLGQPPRTAMVPRLVRSENLVSANSLMLAAAYGTVPVGSLVLLLLRGLPDVSFGGLIPAGNEGLVLAFGLDALTFFGSGLLIASLPRIISPLAEERANNNGDRKSTWADFVEGIRFLSSDSSVRRVIIGMTTALFGGGTVIVLGPDFVENVLRADDAGFYAIITMLGAGAVIGLTMFSINEYRVHREIAFGIATTVTGLGLAAAAMVTTVPGAAAWMMIMGFGAGGAYLMGLSHLHEYVEDELRGRVFATLFSLMRIGLFVAMAIAVPLVNFFDGVDFGRLDDPTRVVLFLGGLTILASGLTVLLALRAAFRPLALGSDAQDIIAAANKARRARMAASEKKTATEPEEGDES